MTQVEAIEISRDLEPDRCAQTRSGMRIQAGYLPVARRVGSVAAAMCLMPHDALPARIFRLVLRDNQVALHGGWSPLVDASDPSPRSMPSVIEHGRSDPAGGCILKSGGSHQPAF